MNKFFTPFCLLLLVGAQAAAMDHQEQLNESLLEAAKAGNLEQLKELIEAKADVNSTGEYDNTALMIAADFNHIPCVQALIEARANINQSNTYGDTALNRSALNQRLFCVQALINANANVNHPNNCGNTALSWATTWKHVSISEALAEAFLHLPNAEQQKKIVILLGLNKCRNKLNSLGFGKNFASAFKPYLRAALYDQNKHDFENSIACQEVNKLKDGLIKRNLLEKYSNKPN